MPRQFLKRYMPKVQDLERQRGLGILGKRLFDPELWHLNRQSVSAAFAVGLFVTWLPIPAQMLVAGAAAMVLRCNLPISVALVWVSNPVTQPALLLFAYQLGTWLLGAPAEVMAFQISWEWFRVRLGQIWAPLLLGSLVSGVVSSFLGWAGMQLFWRWHVVARWERRHNVRRLRAIMAAKREEAGLTEAQERDESKP
ncbi:MAG: DUF2062 domain-containing protein [Gammaproteobacteria bacterium]|nr:DUF2062 domain-containing protein [Gammaproteobacteria bacterium]